MYVFSFILWAPTVTTGSVVEAAFLQVSGVKFRKLVTQKEIFIITIWAVQAIQKCTQFVYRPFLNDFSKMYFLIFKFYATLPPCPVPPPPPPPLQYATEKSCPNQVENKRGSDTGGTTYYFSFLWRQGFTAQAVSDLAFWFFILF